MSDWTQIDFAPRGWVCPKCGRVYAPDWPRCTICGNEQTTISTTTTVGDTPQSMGRIFTKTGADTGGFVREFMVHGGDWPKDSELMNHMEEKNGERPDTEG